MISRRLQFDFTLLFILLTLACVYLAIRAQTVLVYRDARLMWFATPSIISIICGIAAAMRGCGYGLIFACAACGAFFPLTVWAAEISLLSSTQEYVGYFVATASQTLVIVILLSIIASIIGGGYSSLVRFTLDRSISLRFRCIVVFLTSVATVSTLVIGFNRMGDAAFRYRVLGEEIAIRHAIAKNLRNGDTIQRVRAILGRENHVKAQLWNEIQMQSQDRSDFFLEYPDGISVDDEFLAYSSSTQEILQFRNGILINLDERWFMEHYSEP